MATGTFMGMTDGLEFSRHLFNEPDFQPDLFDGSGFSVVGSSNMISSMVPSNAVQYVSQNYASAAPAANTTSSNVSNAAVYAQQFSNIMLPTASSQLQGPPTSVFVPAQPQTSQPQYAPNYYGLQLPSGMTYIPMSFVPQAGQSQSQQLLQFPMTQQGQQGISVQTLTPQLMSSMGMVYGIAPQSQAITVQQPIHYQPYPSYQIKSNGIALNTEPTAPAAVVDDRKKSRASRSSQRRVRHTRPKVIEAKGAVQCQGKNRKKGSQCRNAALMEYIGPRPIYCAEHIELDPLSLYEKCKSPYQKEIGDKKGCKEVVLKEFGLCYKHYVDTAALIKADGDAEKAKLHFTHITELLEQLENEAAAAKKKDGDLYQRKNKLIPKFQEMKRTISRVLEELGALPRSQLVATHTDDTAFFGSSPLSLNNSDSEDNSFSTD
jgi:hypothetical protein